VLIAFSVLQNSVRFKKILKRVFCAISTSSNCMCTKTLIFKKVGTVALLLIKINNILSTSIKYLNLEYTIAR
jgi:hypothetical protein